MPLLFTITQLNFVASIFKASSLSRKGLCSISGLVSFSLWSTQWQSVHRNYYTSCQLSLSRNIRLPTCQGKWLISLPNKVFHTQLWAVCRIWAMTRNYVRRNYGRRDGTCQKYVQCYTIIMLSCALKPWQVEWPLGGQKLLEQTSIKEHGIWPRTNIAHLLTVSQLMIDSSIS